MVDWEKTIKNPCCGLARDMIRELMPASKEEWEKLSCEKLKFFLMQESERGFTQATTILEAWDNCEKTHKPNNWRDNYT